MAGRDGTILLASAALGSLACVGFAFAVRRGLWKSTAEVPKAAGSAATAVAPVSRDTLLAVLSDIAGVAEEAANDTLLTALSQQRHAIAVSQQRGQRRAPIPPEMMWRNIVSSRAAAVLVANGANEDGCLKTLNTCLGKRDRKVTSLYRQILGFSPSAGVDAEAIIRANQAALNVDLTMYEEAVANVRTRLKRLAPGTKQFAAAVENEKGRLSDAEVPVPAPWADDAAYMARLPAALHSVSQVTAAVAALGAPWTPARAAMYTDLMAALVAGPDERARAAVSSAVGKDHRVFMAAREALGVLDFPEEEEAGPMGMGMGGMMGM